jgi:hypothetical protein
MTERLIPVTDDRGRMLLDDPGDPGEPLPGSVVLTNGEYGTAWQRYFSDRMWHRVGGGRAVFWADLIRKRNLVLVYDAPERVEERVQ